MFEIHNSQQYFHIGPELSATRTGRIALDPSHRTRPLKSRIIARALGLPSPRHTDPRHRFKTPLTQTLIAASAPREPDRPHGPQLPYRVQGPKPVLMLH